MNNTNWQQLFLTADGRIGQKDFWIGTLILVAAHVIANVIPILGNLIQLALIYPAVCLASKRLHDFGKSGWLAAVPYGFAAAATVFSLFLAFGALAGVASGSAVGIGAAAAAAGLIGLLLMVTLVVVLAFLLWAGLTKGDPAPNQYGAPTPSSFDGATSTTPTA